MEGIKVDSLDLEDPMGRVRVWFPDRPGRNQDVLKVLEYVASRPNFTLEFWDSRPPTLKKVEKLGIAIDSSSEGQHRLAREVPVSRLPEILEHLEPESFGGWFNVDPAVATRAAMHRENEDRMRDLPAEARFVVFSLYDDNLEVLAPNTGSDQLRREIAGVVTDDQ